MVVRYYPKVGSASNAAAQNALIKDGSDAGAAVFACTDHRPPSLREAIRS